MDVNRHMGGESGRPRACQTHPRTAHPARRAGPEKTQERFFSGRPTNPDHRSGQDLGGGRLEEGALVPALAPVPELHDQHAPRPEADVVEAPPVRNLG